MGDCGFREYNAQPPGQRDANPKQYIKRLEVAPLQGSEPGHVFGELSVGAGPNTLIRFAQRQKGADKLR